MNMQAIKARLAAYSGAKAAYNRATDISPNYSTPACREHVEGLSNALSAIEANALVDITALVTRVEKLEAIVAHMLNRTGLRMDKHRVGWWECSICLASSRDLTKLEQGIGHTQMCAYANGRKLLKE